MLVAQVEVSRRFGFVFVVYNAPKTKPIYGVRIMPRNLDEALEKGINYKVSLDTLVSIEELKTGEKEEFSYNYDEKFESEGIDPFE